MEEDKKLFEPTLQYGQVHFEQFSIASSRFLGNLRSIVKLFPSPLLSRLSFADDFVRRYDKQPVVPLFGAGVSIKISTKKRL